MPNPRKQPTTSSDPEETDMTPTTPQPETAAQFYDDYDDGFAKQVPRRRRFTFLTPLTAGLISLIVGGVGFFVGVRVEKSKVGSSAGGASSFAARFGGSGGATGSARGARAGSFAGAPGAVAGGFAGFGRAAGTTGSVTAVGGDTLYVKESSGNTVKVKLNRSTSVTKSESVSKAKIFPGDEVTIQGPSGSGGTVTATAVTDSGASATTGATTAGASGASGSAATGSGSTGASVASSLFGG
jgi:hypothetical protein